jgi:Pectate lyase superfamily protein
MIGPNRVGVTALPGDSSSRLATTEFASKSLGLNVLSFGADPTGANDSTAAFQAAITAAAGKNLYVPFGNYKISSTLNIGNGTTTTVSTIQAPVIVGLGNPNTFIGYYPAQPGPKLTWAGGASPMFSINGPLQGWGIQNLFLEGSGVAGNRGILVTSAALGDCRNLTMEGWAVGILSTSNPLGGYSVGNVDSFRNVWKNIFVEVPAVLNAVGIVLTGSSDVSSDTDYNIWENVYVNRAGVAINYGIKLSVCDSNIFINVAAFEMQLDYTVSNIVPAANQIYGYEIISFANAGSPSASAKPNIFVGAITANSIAPPALANTQALDGPWLTYTPAPSSNTATFTVNSAKYNTFGKTTQIELDISITGGAPTTSYSFNLPNTANSGGGVCGRELNSSFKAVSGAIFGGGTTCQVVKADETTFAVGERVIVSGVYENT